MADLNSFILQIQKLKISMKELTEEINIVVHRPHAFAADDLRKMYKDQGKVNIIVDRRYGERRRESQSITAGSDRRADDRRNHTERDWRMNLIVKRPYAYLIDDFQRVFKDQDDVSIIVDNRHGDSDRRKKEWSISEDRRSSDRRKANATLAEVVISC